MDSGISYLSGRVFLVLSSIFFLTEAFLTCQCRFGRNHQISMMSSPSPSFLPVEIVRKQTDAVGLTLIEVDAGSLAPSYKLPGQYCQVKLGEGKPGFYAIASPPGERTFTFLVKETDNNKWLTNAPEGSKVEVTSPQGKGFQIEEYFDKYKFDFPTTNVYLLATGSGLSPIAAAIESEMLGLRVKQKNSLVERTATLYIGARTADHLPFKNKYDKWRNEKGVTVIPVLSNPSSDWTGRTGYVQDSFIADKIKVPRNTGVLLCGHRGMTDTVKDYCLNAGVFEGRVLMNF